MFGSSSDTAVSAGRGRYPHPQLRSREITARKPARRAGPGDLLRAMAERVVAAAGSMPVAVVSNAREVRAWAVGRGLTVLEDPGSLDEAAAARAPLGGWRRLRPGDRRPCRSTSGHQPGAPGPGRERPGGGRRPVPPRTTGPRCCRSPPRCRPSVLPTAPDRSGCTPPPPGLPGWPSGCSAIGHWAGTWTLPRTLSACPSPGGRRAAPGPPGRVSRPVASYLSRPRRGGHGRPGRPPAGPGHRRPPGRHRLRLRGTWRSGSPPGVR